MSISLINKDTVVRVSSVLNKYSKQYGKQYITDKCDDTCWNSDQGSPQWIQLDFPRLVSLEELHIQFQGGFAGKESWIEIRDGDDMGKVQSIYPEDNNSLQFIIVRKHYLSEEEYICIVNEPINDMDESDDSFSKVIFLVILIWAFIIN